MSARQPAIHPHGEKYYQAVTEEFAATRPAFRWRHLIGLARVTASAYGYHRADQSGHRAASYEEACRLLEVRSRHMPRCCARARFGRLKK